MSNTPFSLKQYNSESSVKILTELHSDILAEIDGGEECRGRDSQLTQWANTIAEVIRRIGE